MCSSNYIRIQVLTDFVVLSSFCAYNIQNFYLSSTLASSWGDNRPKTHKAGRFWKGWTCIINSCDDPQVASLPNKLWYLYQTLHNFSNIKKILIYFCGKFAKQNICFVLNTALWVFKWCNFSSWMQWYYYVYNQTNY